MARSERHGNTPRDSATLKGMACGPLLAWRSELAIHLAEFPGVPLILPSSVPASRRE